MSVAGMPLIVDKRHPVAVRVILELSRLCLLNGAIGNRARSVAGLDRRSTDRPHPTDSVRRAARLGVNEGDGYDEERLIVVAVPGANALWPDPGRHDRLAPRFGRQLAQGLALGEVVFQGSIVEIDAAEPGSLCHISLGDRRSEPRSAFPAVMPSVPKPAAGARLSHWEQRDVLAGGAIELDEVAPPEVLDPHCVAGQHLRLL